MNNQDENGWRETNSLVMLGPFWSSNVQYALICSSRSQDYRKQTQTHPNIAISPNLPFDPSGFRGFLGVSGAASWSYAESLLLALCSAAVCQKSMISSPAKWASSLLNESGFATFSGVSTPGETEGFTHSWLLCSANQQIQQHTTKGNPRWPCRPAIPNKTEMTKNEQ